MNEKLIRLTGELQLMYIKYIFRKSKGAHG